MNENVMKNILKNETTPLYVFDIDRLKNRVQFLRSSLPQNIDFCYAIKANPFLSLILSHELPYLEICSPGELKICQRLNIPHSQYVISGISKDEEDIASLMEDSHPVAFYTAESLFQFMLLRNTARRFNKKVKVLLRLTSGSQFGIDQKELTKLVKNYCHDPWIEIEGLQYFSGTQKNSIKKLTREINFLDDFLEELYTKYHCKMPRLEYGPGFPVSYFEGEDFDEEAFLKNFSDLLTKMRYDGSITLEIGRSLAASCGTYLTRVVDKKQNNGENYAIVDGGMHHIVYYGHFMAMKHPHFSIMPSRPDSKEKLWNICGSLCTANDFLVKKIPIKGLCLGDVLTFENAGAYCMTEGLSLFLSRDLPEVILLHEDGSYTVVRNSLPINELNTPHGDLTGF